MAKAKRIAARPKRVQSRSSGGWGALVDWADGGCKSASGQRVNESTAMRLSVYYACVRNIAEDCAKLPLITYRRLKRGKERATDHPAYRLLRVQPNPAMTAFSFRETLTHHAIAYGNGFAEIVSNNAGVPQSLWPMDPARTTVVSTPDGGTAYEYTLKTGGIVTLSSSRVLHIHGLGFDGMTGYSVARIAKESLGGALAAQDFSGRFFGNGAHPIGVLQHPGKLTEKSFDNLKRSWKASYSGENSLSPAILEEGMTWNKMSVPPEDAQFLETRQFQVEDICRWFRMPPHKVGHLLRAQGWSTLEQTNADYLTEALMTWLVRWEQEVMRRLFADSEQDEYFVEHLTEKLLSMETDKRYAAYAVGVVNGWINRNEVRERENMNPVDGLDGYLVPMNMQQAGDGPLSPDPDTPDDSVTKDSNNVRAVRCDLHAAFSELLQDAFARVLRVESDRVRSAARKPGMLEWAEMFYGSHADYVRAAIHPVLCAYVRACGRDVDETSAAAITAIAVYHVETSRRALAQTDAPAELVEAWCDERPRRQASEAFVFIDEAMSKGKQS